MYHFFLVGDSREYECLAVLCRQRWNEFCAKVPKDYAPLTESLQQIHAMDDKGDKLIWQTANEIHQSLYEGFSELLGSQNLTAADASFNEQVISGESIRGTVTYWLPIIKWLIQLLQVVQCGHVNVKNLQDAVLTLASTYREGIAENAEEIANILGLDSLTEILELIPITDKTSTKSQESAQALVHVSEMNKSLIGLLCGTCLTLLVQATMSHSPQTEEHSLKSVLPALRKVLISTKEKKIHFSFNIPKRLISNIQREAQLYKSKCEQVIETLTGGLSQAADIPLRILNEHNYITQHK